MHSWTRSLSVDEFQAVGNSFLFGKNSKCRRNQNHSSKVEEAISSMRSEMKELNRTIAALRDDAARDTPRHGLAVVPQLGVRG